MGAVLAPLCYLGGPVLIRAAWYTAGIVAGNILSLSLHNILLQVSLPLPSLLHPKSS